MGAKKKNDAELPCSATGVCQCITANDLKKTNKKINKVIQEVEEIKKGHECVNKDRITLLENRQDKHFDDIRKDITDLALDVRSVLERLQKKKEQNGFTKQEIEHIHQEESDLSKEVAVIKEKMIDHEEIIKTISGMNERLIKQEERHEALLDKLKGKDEAESKKDSFWEQKKEMIYKIILVILTIIGTAYGILAGVLKW